MVISDSLVGQLLSGYERQNKTVVPRRGTIHDAGGSVSHNKDYLSQTLCSRQECRSASVHNSYCDLSTWAIVRHL